MSYQVSILAIGATFWNAHQAVLDKFNPADRGQAMNHWLEEYACKVICDSWGTWTHLEFSSEQNYLMFALRWS